MSSSANVVRISNLRGKPFAQKVLEKGLEALRKGCSVFKLSESDRLVWITGQGRLSIASFEITFIPDGMMRKYIPELARYYRTPLGNFKVLVPVSEERVYVVHEFPHHTIIEWGEKADPVEELDRVLQAVDLAVFLPFGNVGTLIDSSTFNQVHMGRPQIVMGIYRESLNPNL